MKTSTDVVRELLLSGRHITYRDLEANTEIRTVKLAQRIYDIRHDPINPWRVESGSVPGKGTLKEYWLEPNEISRIKTRTTASISERNTSDEQLLTEEGNIAEKPQESVIEREIKYEQIRLGLPGQL